MENKIIIYTDGSAHPTNPGPGGFSVVVTQNEQIIDCYYKHTNEITTNNREEMKAILWAMIKYGGFTDTPIVYTDSAYALNCFETWLTGWKENGWIKKTDKKPPENLDLLSFYDDLKTKGYKVNLLKIKGHSGNLFNELADKLARGEQI